MASKEEVFNLSTCREVLKTFSLSNTETSVEQNLQYAHAHHESLMCQWVAAEDGPEIGPGLGSQ